jgi:MYXO-CTERM domain-containing protein
MHMPCAALAFASLAALAAATPAAAAVITSLPGGTVLAQPEVNYVGVGPQTAAPGVTWSSSVSNSVFGVTGGYGLSANGAWNGPAAYIGLNTQFGTMTYSFATPVAGVGGFLNYSSGTGTATIAAYDATSTLIESHTLSIATPAATNGGAFFGFLEPTASIAYFTLSDAYVVMRDPTVLAAAPQDMPEPASAALSLLGLVALAAIRRRG